LLGELKRFPRSLTTIRGPTSKWRKKTKKEGKRRREKRGENKRTKGMGWGRKGAGAPHDLFARHPC